MAEDPKKSESQSMMDMLTTTAKTAAGAYLITTVAASVAQQQQNKHTAPSPSSAQTSMGELSGSLVSEKSRDEAVDGLKQVGNAGETAAIQIQDSFNGSINVVKSRITGLMDHLTSNFATSLALPFGIAGIFAAVTDYQKDLRGIAVLTYGLDKATGDLADGAIVGYNELSNSILANRVELKLTEEEAIGMMHAFIGAGLHIKKSGDEIRSMMQATRNLAIVTDMAADEAAQLTTQFTVWGLSGKRIDSLVQKVSSLGAEFGTTRDGLKKILEITQKHMGSIGLGPALLNLHKVAEGYSKVSARAEHLGVGSDVVIKSIQNMAANASSPETQKALSALFGGNMNKGMKALRENQDEVFKAQIKFITDQGKFQLDLAKQSAGIAEYATPDLSRMASSFKDVKKILDSEGLKFNDLASISTEKESELSKVLAESGLTMEDALAAQKNKGLVDAYLNSVMWANDRVAENFQELTGISDKDFIKTLMADYLDAAASMKGTHREIQNSLLKVPKIDIANAKETARYKDTLHEITTGFSALLERLKEVGYALLTLIGWPVLKVVGPAFDYLAKKLESAAKWMTKNEWVAEALAAGLAALLALKLGFLASTFVALTGAIGPLGLIVAGAVVGLILLEDQLSIIGSVLGKAKFEFERFKIFMEDWWTFSGEDIFDGLIDSAKKAFSELKKWFALSSEEKWDSITNQWSSIIDEFGRIGYHWENLKLKVSDWWTFTGEGLLDSLTGTFDTIRYHIENLKLAVSDWWTFSGEEMGSGLIDAFSSIRYHWENIKLAISDWWEFTALDMWDKMVDGLIAVKNSIFSTFVDIFQPAWDWVMEWFGGHSPSKFGNAIVEGIVAVKDFLYEAIIAPFGDAFAWVIEGIRDLKQRFKDWMIEAFDFDLDAKIAGWKNSFLGFFDVFGGQEALPTGSIDHLQLAVEGQAAALEESEGLFQQYSTKIKSIDWAGVGDTMLKGLSVGLLAASPLAIVGAKKLKNRVMAAFSKADDFACPDYMMDCFSDPGAKKANKFKKAVAGVGAAAGKSVTMIGGLIIATGTYSKLLLTQGLTSLAKYTAGLGLLGKGASKGLMVGATSTNLLGSALQGLGGGVMGAAKFMAPLVAILSGPVGIGIAIAAVVAAIAALVKHMGGFEYLSTAITDTLGEGGLSTILISIVGLFDDIGSVGLEVWGALKDMFSEIASQFSDGEKGGASLFQMLADGFAFLMKAIGGILKFVGFLIVSFIKLLTWAIDVTDIFGAFDRLIVEPLKGIFGAIGDLFKAESFSDVGKAIVDMVWAVIKGIGDAILWIPGVIARAIADILGFEDMGEWMQKNLFNMDGLIETFTNLGPDLWRVLKTVVLAPIGNLLHAMFIQPVIDAIQFFSNLGSSLSNIGKLLYDVVIAPIGNLLDAMFIQPVKDAIEAFSNLGSAMIDGLKLTGKILYNVFIQPFVDAWNWVKGIFVGESPSQLISGLVESFGSFGGMIVDAIIGVFTFVPKMIWNLFTGVFGDLAGWIAEKFGAIWDGIKGVGQNITVGVEKVRGVVGDVASDTWGGIKSFFGADEAEKPLIEKVAETITNSTKVVSAAAGIPAIINDIKTSENIGVPGASELNKPKSTAQILQQAREIQHELEVGRSTDDSPQDRQDEIISILTLIYKALSVDQAGREDILRSLKVKLMRGENFDSKTINNMLSSGVL